jgi:hypothetical protein
MGRGGTSGSRGVFLLQVYQSGNTPLHPSKEGNRTIPRSFLLKSTTAMLF